MNNLSHCFGGSVSLSQWVVCGRVTHSCCDWNLERQEEIRVPIILFKGIFSMAEDDLTLSPTSYRLHYS